MTDTDRLAALLHDIWRDADPFPPTIEHIAARLIAAGVTLDPRPECPYCEGQMCARFDNLNCTHNAEERHGYPLVLPGFVPVRLYSGGVLADGTTNTEPIDFLNPPPASRPAPDWSVAPGEVLREWFTERGITQAEVAARMGVAPPEVSKLVNGHDRITPRMALALERACGINADVLARMQTDHDLAALRAALEAER